jgi:hypothetical protein
MGVEQRMNARQRRADVVVPGESGLGVASLKVPLQSDSASKSTERVTAHR